MGGGCYSGPQGTVCWGEWWVPLVVFGFFAALAVGVAIIAVAALIQLARNPREFVGYYLSTRNLVVLPLTFGGYMAIMIGGQYLTWRYRLPLWASAALALPALALLSYGSWRLGRSSSRSSTSRTS